MALGATVKLDLDFDRTPDGLVLGVDDKNVSACLVLGNRRLRDYQRLHRFADFENYPHAHPVGENAFRIGEDRAQGDRIGIRIGLHADEIELSRLIVGRAVGEPQTGDDRIELLLRHVAARLDQLALAYVEDDLDRILFDYGREHAAVWADEIARRISRLADAAGDRAFDLGIG